MTAIVLHLSDIHFRSGSDPVLSRAEQIAASVFSNLADASVVLMIVSGDIAFSGKSEEYEGATALLTQVCERIRKEREIPVHVFVVPGNHDCDFSKTNAARRTLVKHLTESLSPEIDDSVIQTCTFVQDAFFSFRDKVEEQADRVGDRLRWIARVEVEGRVIGVEALNVSWTSQLHEEPGRLFFPVDRYSRSKQDDLDLRLVVLHHPLNWFSQSMYRPFRTFVRKGTSIVFSGHEHQGAVGIIQDADVDSSAYVEGCVLQGEVDLSDSSFNVVVIDLAEMKFLSTQFKSVGDHYEPTGVGSWSSYRELPHQQPSKYPFRQEFQARVEDPGPFLRHPKGSALTLGDIFVYPDLRRVEADEKRRVHESSDKFIDPESVRGGVILEAQEKGGASSLLHQLVMDYHQRGFVPVLLHGRDLSHPTSREIDSVLNRAVEEQYGKEALSTYAQLPKDKKILLVDGLDRSPVKASKQRVSILKALQDRYDFALYSVNETFEIREFLTAGADLIATPPVHFQVQPFGFRLRAELAKRWFSIGSDGTLDDASFIARCDEAERVMDAVMTRGIIPAVPLYLLTLLQGFSAGKSGDFRESSLGYYYQSLLSENFIEAGVKADKLTELFDYCSELAWFFHARKCRELGQRELRKFNEEFSKKWHTVELGPRLEVLVKARVLSSMGGEYSFRYPYIFYFLKGLFLKKNLQDAETRLYVAHCCSHLYVRDHANTVLFLAHHTNDEFVLTSIGNAIQEVFADKKPLLFERGDSEVATKLIQHAPELRYAGTPPEEHREKVKVLQDELDDGNDGLADKEESSADLSLIAKLVMLFKSTEILGQVLKNQYSGIPRDRRVELIEKLFLGPLRALRTFYDYLSANPDWFVAEIDATLERRGKQDKEERERIASRIVASLIQLITLSFLIRAARGANSDSLAEDVAAVVGARSETSFALIDLAILLDSPKDIPRGKVEQMTKRTEPNSIARRVLQLLVLNRLYMFKTNERDMQWLAQEVDISLEVQKAIAFRSRKLRVLKS
jgi:UDP-2,3-diacylglucosamine pyrophosphatase LpxH